MHHMRAMPFIVLGLFGLYTLEFGVIGTLPVIIDRFGITVAQAGSLLGLFALTVAVLGPFIVLFSSRFERKQVLIASLAVFTVSSVASAFSTEFWMLLALRIVCALFHPMFFSASLSTAVALYPPGQSGRAISTAVFGTTLGLIVGVPAMAWVGARYGLAASFQFSAAVTAIAALGIVLRLPHIARGEPLSFSEQLAVLRRTAVWMSLVSAVLIFTALFAVYSFASEVLQSHLGMPAGIASAALMIFGVGGVIGNMFIGRRLDTRLLASALAQPVALAAIYVLLGVLDHPSAPTVFVTTAIWGAIHTAGLIVSQVWLRTTAPEAPDFVTSLYLTAANLGVLGGSVSGGFAIDGFGTGGATVAGIAFSLLALALVGLKASLYGTGWTKRGAPDTACPDADPF